MFSSKLTSVVCTCYNMLKGIWCWLLRQMHMMNAILELVWSLDNTKRENIRSGAGVKPVFYASQSDHATSEKKAPSNNPKTAKASHGRKQKNPKSSHTIPLLPSRRTSTTVIAWSPEPELKETIDLKKKTTCSHAHSFLLTHKKLPSCRTSTTATQIAGAERFRRRRVRRSLEGSCERASKLFTSSSNESGDLCGGMLRCVVWWRFGQEEVEGGRGRKQRKPEIFA